MATLITAAERNADADRAASAITYLSLHVTTPGITGAAEATGGAPAYARQPVVFNPAGTQGPLGLALQPATTGVAWSTEVTFDVPAGSYAFWGSWNDPVAGLYLRGNNILPGTQTPSSQGQIKHSIGVGPFSGA
jgi:hypothetical protein